MTGQLDEKLSRYLLQNGLVQKAELEDAVQQQLVHGGALDTLLLELGLCELRPLQDALSAAYRCEPVSDAALAALNPDISAVIPERTAVSLGLCPLRDEAGTLDVLCAAPIDRALLEEIGTLVQRVMVPRVLPEVRLWEALAKVYDISVDDRYVSLLQLLDADFVPAPPELASIPPLTASAAPFALREHDKWDLVEALANLAVQEDRDGISKVTVRYARQHLPFAAIFGVRDNRLCGWERDGPADGPQFFNAELPIPIDSVVQQVLNSPSPLLGKPPITDGNAATLGWLGRRRPRTALLVPIVVAGRAVAVLYADGGVRQRRLEDLSEVVAFGARLGPAFEALLRKRHRGGRRDPLIARNHMPSVPTPEQNPPEGFGFDEPSGEITAPGRHHRSDPHHIPPEEKTADYEPMPDADAAAPPSTEAAPTVIPELNDGGDGTSPFARGYGRTASPLSTPALRAASSDAADASAGPMSMDLDSEGGWNLMLDKQPAAAARNPTFAEVDDDLRGEFLTAPPKRQDDIALGSFDDDDESSEPVPAADAASNAVDGASNAVDAASSRADDDLDDAERGLLTSPTGGFKALLPADDAADPRSVVDPALIASPRPEETVRSRDVVEAANEAVSSVQGEALELLREDGWEDVELDPAHVAQLDPVSRPAVPTVNMVADSFEQEDTTGMHAVQIGTLVLNKVPPEEAINAPDVEDLVGMLNSLHESRVREARRHLLHMGPKAKPALTARFPGGLRKDPLDNIEPVETAAEIGPLIELCEAFGKHGVDIALPHVASPSPVTRFCAAFVFVLVPDERAIDALLPVLFDEEERTSRVAAAALSYFIAHPRFVHVLSDLRRRLDSTDEPERQQTIVLLGNFRDVASVPNLIRLLDSSYPRTVQAARSALYEITLQDHGKRRKTWSRWWDKARKKNRIEWLLDGLRSRDTQIRLVAANDLLALTGQDYGYRYDGSRRARDGAVQRYEEWWADERAQRGMI